MIQRMQQRTKHIVKITEPGFIWMGPAGSGRDYDINPEKLLKPGTFQRRIWAMYAMEMYDGDCLTLLLDVVKAQRLDLFTSILKQCVMAIRDLHNMYIVHRDVKCENFLFRWVDTNKTQVEVVMSDLGLATDETLPPNVRERTESLEDLGAQCSADNVWWARHSTLAINVLNVSPTRFTGAMIRMKITNH